MGAIWELERCFASCSTHHPPCMMNWAGLSSSTKYHHHHPQGTGHLRLPLPQEALPQDAGGDSQEPPEPNKGDNSCPRSHRRRDPHSRPLYQHQIIQQAIQKQLGLLPSITAAIAEKKEEALHELKARFFCLLLLVLLILVAILTLVKN